MKKFTFLLLVISAMFLVACGGESSSQPKDKGKSNQGDSITYASISDAAGLSPILMNDSASANITEHVYEQLFVRNVKTKEIEPLLAESYENPDENTWIIKLKEGIKFHDGTPFNAEAVKYTFDKLADPATAAPRASLMEPVESVSVEDEYTVKIVTKYSYGPFLASLTHTNAAIVSPTADEKQDLMKDPVGTGPYKFVSWVPGDQIILEANPDYRDGEPAMKKVVFKVVPEISTAISMLQAGEIQLLDQLPTEQIERIESMKNVEVEKVDGTPVNFLAFNHSKKENQDPEFRKAVASAIDRDAIVSKLNGLGIRSDSMIGPEVFGYNEAAANGGTPYDVEVAKDLVTKNDYGKREIKLLSANRGNYQLMAEIVQSQLTEAGFKVEIESMEWATFLDATRAGDYDITFLSWANVTGDGSELFYPNFHSDNLDSSNRSHYSNPEFDKIVNASRTTIDSDERLELLDKANQLMLDENVTVVISHGVIAAAIDNNYKGLILDPNGKWYVHEVTGK